MLQEIPFTTILLPIALTMTRRWATVQDASTLVGRTECLSITIPLHKTAGRPGIMDGPIKYFNDGYLNGCKIYNNTLHKIMNAFSEGANNWDFAIELFNETGLEIYNNTLDGGSIDINHNTKGAYAFSAWIHDNTITMPSLNTYIQTGITLEFETDGAIVENNIIDKANVGYTFYTHADQVAQ
ncbi:MAG: hypothetical protein WDM90_20820 [Ferruginibacter sp.]